MKMEHKKTWHELSEDTRNLYRETVKRRLDEGLYDFHLLTIFKTEEELAMFTYNQSIADWTRKK
jgi:hypothetical protein